MENIMKASILLPLVGGLLFVVSHQANSASMDDKNARIRSAMSAAPHSVADKATIKDWPAEKGEGTRYLVLHSGIPGAEARVNPSALWYSLVLRWAGSPKQVSETRCLVAFGVTGAPRRSKRLRNARSRAGSTRRA